MKKALLVFCIIFSFNTMLGQIFTKGDGQVISSSNFGFIKGNHLPDGFLSSDGSNLRYENIQGSPYINNNSGAENNLPIGKAYTENSKYIGTAFIRYNAYTDNMEISLMDDGVDYYLLKKEIGFLYIVLKKKTYRAYEYLDNNKKALGFFVIESEKDTNMCTLLKKEKVIFKEETKPKNSFLTSSPARFNRIKDTYYLMFENKAKLVPKKRKDLWVLFPEKQKEIKAFIESEKIKPTNINDLQNVVNYYNSLF
ncbi:hypothetical protein [Algibacter sp. PT7-4]|uniref:hypothetical protein n=1 Tax=Algibacter ulvanivorans TaxID=3400999 RepID=UPI003AAF5548